MRPTTVRASDSGFATTEFVLGFGVLVLPMVLLVTLLPTWSEARLRAETAADAAARAAAIAAANGTDPHVAAARAAAPVLAAHGLRAGVEVDASETRVTVRVAVALPGIPVLRGAAPGPPDVTSAFTTTAIATHLVDLYRGPDG